ncbi:hypothetical protein E0H82_03710 [Acinetobacter sp. ANC 4910]|nr:hypothetical protein E0H82_03710 [Acinetobacter sp. ANC 4910]
MSQFKLGKVGKTGRKWQYLRQICDKMKIPKPRKRGDAYRIELMFNGKRYSANRSHVIDVFISQKLKKYR